MTFSVFTLGCKTNFYESQQIVAQLENAGYSVFSGLKAADVVVINTCAVTKEAEKKSRQAIARAKALNPNCKVIVCGCAAQKTAEQFENCGAVFVKGVANKEKILSYVDKSGVEIDELPSVYQSLCAAKQSRTRAYVKIQDGCNNFCSYCIVPYLRGRSRSKSVFDVVEEVKATCAKEIVLTGIDISQYGKDIGETLASLFAELSKHTSARLRLGSLEPRAIDDELLTALSITNFCQHFHLSMQSGCDEVLSRMNRKYTTERYFQAVEKIRSYFPNCGITTDVIVGFSGETQSEFETTLAFIEKCAFSDVHVFPFSAREGTAAANKDDVSPQEKKRRAEEAGLLKQKLKRVYLEKQMGKTEEVLFEQRKKGCAEGYTPNYVKVYCADGKCGAVQKVKIVELYADGVRGELTED